MAKGFTVKAAAPTPKTEEWDYGAIKERMKGKSIVFCLPGRGCSFIFLKAFVQLCFDLVQNGMSIQISQDYSSMVNCNMIINFGLTRILSSILTSSGNFVMLLFPHLMRKVM